jgi:hypothetical protein
MGPDFQFEVKANQGERAISRGFARMNADMTKLKERRLDQEG